MSNGDDVLDNWEEIDEAGLNNTLQKIEAVRQIQKQQVNNITTNDDALYSYACSSNVPTTISASGEFQPMKVLQRTPTQDSNSSNSSSTALKSPLEDMSATFQPVMMVLHKSNDEYDSANYTQPINSQTVKILRRPTQSSEPRNNGMKPRQPIKTLQQREQEYAEARLRILGAAKNPEDDVGTSTTNPAMSAGNSATPPPAIGNNTPTIARVNSTPKMQTGVGPNIYNNHYQQQQPLLQPPQQQQQQPNYYFSQPAYNNRTLLTTTPTTTMTPLQHQLQQKAQPQTWSPVVGGSVSSPMLRQQQQQLQQLQQQQQQQLLPLQQQESILRMPRGPDGSTGFQMRR